VLDFVRARVAAAEEKMPAHAEVVEDGALTVGFFHLCSIQRKLQVPGAAVPAVRHISNPTRDAWGSVADLRIG
jgi:hypothetical protein